MQQIGLSRGERTALRGELRIVEEREPADVLERQRPAHVDAPIDAPLPALAGRWNVLDRQIARPLRKVRGRSERQRMIGRTARGELQNREQSEARYPAAWTCEMKTDHFRDAGSAVILTARDSVDHRLLGLNAGADDYIVKPFHLRELEARLRAVLRRPGRRRDAVYTRGGVCFDPLSREATVSGSPLPLTRREATLLEELLRAPGQVIAKDILEERLYALEDAGSANALEAAMSRLRRKLAAARAGLRIETQWGIGYRLIEQMARPADEAAGSESIGR